MAPSSLSSLVLKRVKFDRSGSGAGPQSGGRRPGRVPVRQRPWRPLPAPEVLSGEQGERNQRKGLGDPQGAAGRRKEGAVNPAALTHRGAGSLP